MEFIEYCKEMISLAAQAQVQGIWFWAAVYALLVCMYSFAFQIRTRGWPSTRGTLNNLGVEKFGAGERVTSEQDYVGRALYHYRVDDREYTGKRISPWVMVASHNARFLLQKQQAAIQPAEDGTVTVYYNPGKPEKSYLVLPGTFGMIVTLVLGFAPLVLYWVRY